jgi:hypothetical protein
MQVIKGAASLYMPVIKGALFLRRRRRSEEEE